MRLPIRRTIGPPPLHVIETEIRGDISLYDAQNERVRIEAEERMHPEDFALEEE